MKQFEDIRYKVIRTEKGISSLHIFSPKVFEPSDPEVIDFLNPKAHVLDMHGTPFQKKVWTVLCGIERGQTKTYSDVARMIGKPLASRSVASAIARNNIAILIPCHRVIRMDGQIGEYRWGKDVKEILLRSEGVL